MLQDSNEVLPTLTCSLGHLAGLATIDLKILPPPMLAVDLLSSSSSVS